MKVAIVHDSLAEFGGAERVLQVLLAIYPDADVYTAYTCNGCREKHFPGLIPGKLHTSFLQAFPIEHHTSLIQSIAPLVWRSFRLDAYDLVISQSMHIMSSLVMVPRGTHITIVQTPPKNIIGASPPVPLQQIIPYAPLIRRVYQRSLQRIPHVVSNSRHTQHMLKHYLGIPSSVIYPPVTIPSTPNHRGKGTYYLCVSRIDDEKGLDLAIEAANKLRVPLKIAGRTNAPSYERYLRSIAGPTVTFLGFLPDTTIQKLYRNAIAFIFPSESEDFGIAPLEASAHGVPVIAYFGGGAKETVIEKKTGTFFRTHTKDSLIRAMKRLQTMHFDPQVLYTHASSFSTERFTRAFVRYVEAAFDQNSKAMK